MTRRDELDHVLDGIEAAKEAGFDPVKINTVVQRGVNDDEIVDLADVRPRARRRGALHRVHAARRRRAAGPTARSSARTRSSPRSPPCTRSSSCRPAARRRPTAGATSTGGGTVGVIPSVTKPFCGDCDRVRLTADGQFRTCLFATDEFDLRKAMRGRRERRRAGRRASSGPSARSGPGTRSTRSTSSARSAR